MALIPEQELTLLHKNICQALADPKRIQILYALHDSPLHVTALAALLETPQPTVSRHLAVLRQRALVIRERQGAAVVYRLASSDIIDVIQGLRRVLHGSLTRQAAQIESGLQVMETDT